MKKSIYYLIANALSTIAVAIFLGVMSSLGNQFPFFGFDLVVTGLSANAFEPMKIILPILALSIIHTTRDLVRASEGKTSLLDKVFDIAMGVITVLSILLTWTSAVLIFEGYKGLDTIVVPYFFLAYFLVGLIALLISPVITKKFEGLGTTLPFAGILLAIGGFVAQCLVDYWWVNLIVVGVVLLVTILITLLSTKSKR